MNYPPDSKLLSHLVPYEYRAHFRDWLLRLPCNYGRAQLAEMVCPTKDPHQCVVIKRVDGKILTCCIMAGDILEGDPVAYGADGRTLFTVIRSDPPRCTSCSREET